MAHLIGLLVFACIPATLLAQQQQYAKSLAIDLPMVPGYPKVRYPE